MAAGALIFGDLHNNYGNEQSDHYHHPAVSCLPYIHSKLIPSVVSSGQGQSRQMNTVWLDVSLKKLLHMLVSGPYE